MGYTITTLSRRLTDYFSYISAVKLHIATTLSNDTDQSKSAEIWKILTNNAKIINKNDRKNTNKSLNRSALKTNKQT